MRCSFPINVNLDDSTGAVEIRNFLGEKIIRRVTILPGVEFKISENVKDEIVLSGNSLEAVSQTAADIQQICRVRNKDIRKVCCYNSILGARVRGAGEENIARQGRKLTKRKITSSWTVSTSLSVATSLRMLKGFLFSLWGLKIKRRSSRQIVDLTSVFAICVIVPLLDQTAFGVWENPESSGDPAGSRKVVCGCKRRSAENSVFTAHLRLLFVQFGCFSNTIPFSHHFLL